MRKIIIKSLLLLFFVSIMFVNNQTLFKTNNSTNISSSSTTLPLGSVASGTLTSTSNPASYVFTITVEGAYSINFTYVNAKNAINTMDFMVVNSTGSTFFSGSNGPMNLTQMLYADSFTLNITGQGQYWVTVFKAPAGMIPADPIPLKLDTVVTGTIQSWYYYQNLYYNISLPYYATYKFTQNYIGPDNLSVSISPGVTQPSLFTDFTHNSTTRLLTAGNYIINFHKYFYSGSNSYFGPVNLSVELIPNNPYYVIDSAQPANLNAHVTGNTSTANLFNVSISTSGSYKFNLTADQSSTYWLYIFNSSYDLIGNATSYSYPEQETLNLTTGFYYIQIYNISGSGTFSLEVSNYNPVTQPTSTPSSSTSSTTKTTTTTKSTTTTTSSSTSKSSTSSSSKSTSSSSTKPSTSTTSSTSKNTKTSPFSSLDVIIMSFIFISSISLIMRRRK